MSSRQIAHGLEHGEIDAGLTYLDNEPLAHVDTLPLWREHYLLVTPAGSELGAAATVPWGVAAELPLCLLTPDMQHRRIVDGAFAAAGATPQPGGGDQLRLDADRARARAACPASPRTPGSTPTRCPPTCARSRSSSPRSSTRSGSSPRPRSSARR